MRHVLLFFFNFATLCVCVCARVCVLFDGAAKMTTSIPQGSLLDVLKKKMRQTKEEMERYKDECEEITKRLHLEAMRREEVSRRWKKQFAVVVVCGLQGRREIHS